MTNRVKIRGAYIILIAGAFLLLLNLYHLDFDRSMWYAGPLSNVLLMLSMVVSLREMKKQKKLNS
jgi:hypothetical protein